MQLKEVQQIGMWYCHFFDRGSGVESQECTKEEYESLGLPGAGAPNVPGRWISSAHLAKFDTVSGFLEEGTFCKKGEVCWVKTGGKEGVVESSKISKNGTLTDGVQIK